MRVETRSPLFVQPAGGGGFLHEQHVLKWLSKGSKFMLLLTCCCPVCFVVFFMHLVVLKLLHRDTAFMLVWNNTFYFVLQQIIKSFLRFPYFYCILFLFIYCI